MTGFWRGEESEIVRLRLTPTVWETWHIDSLEMAAARGTVSNGTMRQAVHLKVDTGMGRLGVSLDELPSVLKALKAAPHLLLEGLSTHLASSEIMDAPSVGEQERSFEEALRMVRAAEFVPELVHMANTSALISRRETWNTRILSMRNFAANQALGYGGTYVTKAPAHVAVLPVGYADGYNRQLSNRGRVIVRDHYAPIVGSISMDLTLVDVTGIPDVAVGDEVILLGTSDGLSVDALEHARLANSSPYEILCNISKRVPRKYGS